MDTPDRAAAQSAASRAEVTTASSSSPPPLPLFPPPRHRGAVPSLFLPVCSRSPSLLLRYAPHRVQPGSGPGEASLPPLGYGGSGAPSRRRFPSVARPRSHRRIYCMRFLFSSTNKRVRFLGKGILFWTSPEREGLSLRLAVAASHHRCRIRGLLAAAASALWRTNFEALAFYSIPR